MSGIHDTIVQVSRREINRAIQNAQRSDRDYLNRQLAQQDASARRREKEMHRRIDQQNQRAAQYENRLTKLDHTLQQTRLQHCREMEDMRQNFQNDVQGLSNRMDDQRQEFLNRLKAQGDHFEQALDQHGRQLNQLSQAISQRIEHQEDIANQWITALNDEIDFIRNHYRHTLFTPGELDALNADLTTARNDMSQSMPQSALSLSREAFHKACRLHDKLEYQETIWNTLYPSAVEAVSNAHSRLVAHKNIDIALDSTSGQVTSLDIDYWMWNQRQELEDEMEGLNEKLAKTPDTLSIANLETMIDQAGQASDKLDALYQQSLARMVASIKRNDIQDQIRETLSAWGYDIVEATLQGETGEDFRGSHFMKLKNAGGDEIVTVVEPGQDETEGEQRIRFNFFDQSPNEAMRSERIRAIGDALKNEGLTVNPAQCVPEYRNKNAPDDVRDFSRCKKPVTPPRKTV